MTDISIQISSCPGAHSINTDKEDALSKNSYVETGFCDEASALVDVTVNPPKRKRKSPEAVCKRFVDGTCPLLHSKEL